MRVSNISLDLIDKLVSLNDSILSYKITHPATLALELEEITIAAWRESEEMGGARQGEIERLPPSLRIE